MSDTQGAQWNAGEMEADAKLHLLSPSEEMAKLGQGMRPLIAYGAGIHLVDAHGRRIIDGPAGMWCTQIGYGRKEIADAVAAQSLRLSYNSPWYTTNSPSVELARRIAEVTPGDLNRVFFTTGGSTAVDSALRFTEYYNNVMGRPDKKHIIVRREGYHGSTSLTRAHGSAIPRPAGARIRGHRRAPGRRQGRGLPGRTAARLGRRHHPAQGLSCPHQGRLREA